MVNETTKVREQLPYIKHCFTCLNVAACFFVCILLPTDACLILKLAKLNYLVHMRFIMIKRH